MESQEMHVSEKLKEIVVKGHKENYEIVFMMIKDGYKGINVYQVYSMVKKDGKIIDINESQSTYSERDAENYFDMLVNTYLRYRYAKIVK